MRYTTRYASPVDVAMYGPYRCSPDAGSRHRFTGRIIADRPSRHPARPGRYHLYACWSCPHSHRVTIERALHGLEGVISLSYVDNDRDARGWAFREPTGPDPVNGFRLLREAYEATEPDFDGQVSVPVLWDRATVQIVSNDADTIGIDLATQFGRWGNGADTYPAQLRGEIEELNRLLGPAFDRSGNTVTAALTDLDERLASRRFLLGGQLTEADIRLWVRLVRHATNLPTYRHLWGYARELYQHPAFRNTTRFDRLGSTGNTNRDWNAPHDRARLPAIR